MGEPNRVSFAFTVDAWLLRLLTHCSMRMPAQPKAVSVQTPAPTSRSGEFHEFTAEFLDLGGQFFVHLVGPVTQLLAAG
jgi:hypothetical protein